MSEHKWQKLTPETAINLLETDECYSFMEYSTDYKAKNRDDWPRANQLIIAFKNIKASDVNEAGALTKYKTIQEFVNEIKRPVKSMLASHKKIGLTFIPTSKSEQDPNYSYKFEIIMEKLRVIFGDQLVLEQLVKNKQTRPSASQDTIKRDRAYVDQVKDNWQWVGISTKVDVLIVIDDVITTGGQFRALVETIESNTAENQRPAWIIGLFWAKSIWE